MRGADLLVTTLSHLGVGNIFTLSGNQIMSIFDASLETTIDLLHVRHEAAAVHAADTWGRLKGEPGIALVTAGPGFANTLSALYVAMEAESPMVLLSGHSPLKDQGRGAFQEMAQSEMAKPVTKSSWTSTDSSTVAHDIARAFKLAHSGRPGPVHVALPSDVLEGIASSENNPTVDISIPPLPNRMTSDNINTILSAIQSSKRPVVLPGQAVSRVGEKSLSDLCAITSIPTVTMESPRGVKDPSLGAFAEVLAESDLVLLLGKKLDFGLMFGESPSLSDHCKIIHIDHDESALEQTRIALNQSDRLIVAAQADPIEAAQHISESVKFSVDKTWIREVQSATSYVPAEWSELGTITQDGPLHPVAVCKVVQDVLNERDSIFVSDGGEFGQWTQACISSPHRVINGPGGAIGGSIPAAIAARLAYPNATVIAMLGDGTFGFHGMEFDTAVRYNLPIIVVVGNDAKWNAECQIQIREYGHDRMVGCELGSARYDLVAQALGGHGENVTVGTELGPALHRALDSGLPSCINVSIQPVPAPIVTRIK